MGKEVWPNRRLTIVIPAYNPDQRLLELLKALKPAFESVVLVDDGSTTGRDILDAARPLVERLVTHPVNRGKGAAIKSALAVIDPAADIITADSDGQHTPADIAKIRWGLARHRNGLVLGVRAFEGNVPLRSRFGNFATRVFFYLMTGLFVRDTQTGLRGIPSELRERISRLPGDRYEYEMAMLADARYHPKRPLQIPIRTVYFENNAKSHFRPVRDSWLVYRSLIQFCVSSVLSFLLDNVIFAFVIYLFTKGLLPMASRRMELLVGFLVARTISAHFNYFYNRFVVFRTKGSAPGYLHYALLVCVIAAAGYGLTEWTTNRLGIQGVAMTGLKIVVETFLFLASYFVQKFYIFTTSPSRRTD